ncbi:MAG: ATP-binding cassette domain-containing protein [Rhodobacteraceae bacterium]|nr:ATP-binding cassette domain-containing protein [Paracoccaceae bacterium]
MGDHVSPAASNTATPKAGAPVTEATPRQAASAWRWLSAPIRRFGSEGSPSSRSVNGVKKLRASAGATANDMRLDPAIMGAAVAVNLLALAMPVVVLQVYDRIAPNGAQDTLLVLSLGLLMVAFCELALRCCQGYLLTLSAARFGQALQIEALRRHLWPQSAAAPSDTDTDSTKDVLERFSAIDNLVDYYGGQGRLAMIELPFSAIFFVMIAIVGGWLVFAPIVLFSVFSVGIIWLGRKAKDLASDRSALDGKMQDFVSETLSSGYTVKSQAMEPLMFRRYERLLKSQAAIQRLLILLGGDVQRMSTVFTNLNVAATLGFGAALVMADQLTMGGLVACSMLSARAIQPLLRVSRAWGDLQRAQLSAERAAPLFDTAPAALSLDRPHSTGPVALEAVDLAIERNGRGVLEHISIQIDAGGLTALVGREGSGRSTFLKVAAGLAPPKSGALLINGAPAAAFREQTANGVSLVGVEARLFPGTILDNLTLYGQGPSIEDARWAADLMGMENIIDKLTLGYHTSVGMNASEALPAGLLRKIVLARAIAQRPQLLLLDEPHLYLDLPSLHQLRRALPALREDSTVIFTTSIGDFARLSDQVLLFSDGQVVDRAPLSYPAGGVIEQELLTLAHGERPDAGAVDHTEAAS